MARPRKTDLEPPEWLAIEGKGNRAAAAIVSDMRGANLGSISGAERARRRVSHKFIERQRRDKTKPGQNPEPSPAVGPGQNSDVAERSGTRVGYESPGGDWPRG